MSSATIIFRPSSTPNLRAVKERRQTSRIRTPVPVTVRCAGEGHGSDLTSVIDNISAGGFYVRLIRKFEPGAHIAALIKFVAGPAEGKATARLAVRGRVVRVEELPGRVYGVAVKIRGYRFI